VSKIAAHLKKALELSPKRGEERQAFLDRVLVEIAGLPDAEWDELPKDVQNWFNEAADVKNTNVKASKPQPLPDFPDLEEAEEAEEPKTTRRRASADDEVKEDKKASAKLVEVTKPKVGQVLKVTTKRGKEIDGHVVEVDSEVLVLKLGNGEEEELDRSRIEKMETLPEASDDKDDDGAADPVKVGAAVTLTTKRGKEITGKIVELDDEVVVLETDDGEEEFSRDRVEKIEVKGGRTSKAKAKDEEPEDTKTTRRSAKADKGDGEGEDKAKRTRSTNEGGVSIGTRIKELIAEDFEATKDDIAKILKKEGLEFRENTLSINYTDCHRFLDILKAKKKLK
jgi:ribosome maturation factor RimP